MNDEIISPDLVEEIEYMSNALSKSGVFNKDEIIEIL